MERDPAVTDETAEIAVASAASSEAAPTVEAQEDDDEDTSHHSPFPVALNKWSRNGYGQGGKLKGGKFTKEESAIVLNAIEEFCATRQIPSSRLCSECEHRAELKGAWMEIAKCLPNRSVQSVYRHGLRRLHPFKRGHWTDEEVEELVELVGTMGKKWSAIQVKLHRSADSCRDKYREMSSEYVKGRWKEAETELLKRLVREHLGANPDADLRELSKRVQAEGLTLPWSTISKRLGKRSRLSCFKKWQKLTGSTGEQFKITSSHASTNVAEDAAVAPSSTEAVTSTNDADAATAVNPTATASPNPAMGDQLLLSHLVHSGATRSEDVDWEGLPEEIASAATNGAQARWSELVTEWQQEESPSEECLQWPIAELAQVLLDRTTRKLAAQTVEAVELPPTTLHADQEVSV